MSSKAMIIVNKVLWYFSVKWFKHHYRLKYQAAKDIAARFFGHESRKQGKHSPDRANRSSFILRGAKKNKSSVSFELRGSYRL